MRAAFGLLLTYVGVPSIYYGDEVGLGGADELHARQPMPWDAAAWDRDLLTFVRTLVHVRSARRSHCDAAASRSSRWVRTGWRTFATPTRNR